MLSYRLWLYCCSGCLEDCDCCHTGCGYVVVPVAWNTVIVVIQVVVILLYRLLGRLSSLSYRLWLYCCTGCLEDCDRCHTGCGYIVVPVAWKTVIVVIQGVVILLYELLGRL